VLLSIHKSIEVIDLYPTTLSGRVRCINAIPAHVGAAFHYGTHAEHIG